MPLPHRLPDDEMMTTRLPGIRLERLTIRNYKKIDFLEIDFPRPRMPGDADVLVLGSKNGGGKTSVLESIALLELAAIFYGNLGTEANSPDLGKLIRAGFDQAEISGIFSAGSERGSMSVHLSRPAGIHLIRDNSAATHFPTVLPDTNSDEFLYRLLAMSVEPLICTPVIYLNSYRKVDEANPELGAMASPANGYAAQNPVSAFKFEVLNALLGQAALFEGISRSDSQAVLSQLNALTLRYSGGKIEHLRQLPGNKVDIRVKVPGAADSFSFDGLSSGQKEIIATLFLIWRHSQNQPCTVLIDEPELHLNAEWHGDFVRQLHQLAPQNQYIMATHSEQMFRSVEEYQRVILLPDDEVTGVTA